MRGNRSGLVDANLVAEPLTVAVSHVVVGFARLDQPVRCLENIGGVVGRRAIHATLLRHTEEHPPLGGAYPKADPEMAHENEGETVEMHEIE